MKIRNRHEGISFYFTLLHSGMKGYAAQHRGLLRSGTPTYAAPGMDAARGLTTDAGCATRDG